MNIPVKTLSLSVVAALALMACGKEPPPPPAPVAAPPPPVIVKIGHIGQPVYFAIVVSLRGFVIAA